MYQPVFAVYITLNRMKLSRDARRAWLVAACFSGVIGFGIGVNVLLGMLPTPEENCTSYCEQKGTEGHMIHILPATTTAGMRGRGPSECKCFRIGTFNPFSQ